MKILRQRSNKDLLSNESSKYSIHRLADTVAVAVMPHMHGSYCLSEVEQPKYIVLHNYYFSQHFLLNFTIGNNHRFLVYMSGTL